MEPLRLDVWSDIACPWCYVGKRRLEAALGRLAGSDAVEVRWRAFELDRTAPRVRDDGLDYAERLARKYRASLEQARAMIDRMVATAAAEGLAFDFDRIRPGNTFDAHRLVALAADEGRAEPVQERFMRGYLTEGAAIGDRETLARLAVEAGLDAGAVRATLESDRYADRVQADEDEAAARGVTSVPTFVAGDRVLVTGAESATVLLAALMSVRNEA